MHRYYFFFYPLSNCLISSLVHFKNGPGYLINGTVSASNIPMYLNILIFPERSKFFFFFWFSRSNLSVIFWFKLFITIMAHFSILNYIPISWFYILTDCIKFFNSFSFLISSMFMKSFIFSWILLSLCISSVFSWVSLSLLQILMVMEHRFGIYVSRFLHLVNFFLLLSVSLFKFF